MDIAWWIGAAVVLGLLVCLNIIIWLCSLLFRDPEIRWIIPECHRDIIDVDQLVERQVYKRRSTDNDLCAVCLEEFGDRETIGMLPRCQHSFHVDCIKPWLRCNLNCPRNAKSERHGTQTKFHMDSDDIGMTGEAPSPPLQDVPQNFDEIPEKHPGDHVNPQSDEAKQMTQMKADTDKDGTSAICEWDSEQELLKAFEIIDRDNNGKISVGDIKKIAKELGEHFTDEEIHEMVEEADRDHDGEVSAEEFRRMMKTSSYGY